MKLIYKSIDAVPHSTGIGRCQTFMIYLCRKRRLARTYGFPIKIYQLRINTASNADFPKWLTKCLKQSRALNFSEL